MNSEKENETLHKRSTLKEKFNYGISLITVEPILLCYLMPSVLSFVSTQKLNLDKACRVNLNYNSTICDILLTDNRTGYEDYLDEVQKIVSQMYTWTPYVRNLIPASLLLFFGSFSDRFGIRKPFILLPLLGELFTTLGLILCVYFYDWPVEVAGIIENIFPALTGSHLLLLMAALSYVAEVSSVESRTMRISLVNVVITFAAPAGVFLSGYMHNFLGFYGVFSIVALLYALGFFYGYFWLPESKLRKKLPKNYCKDIFNPVYVIDTLQVLTKKRNFDKQLKIILIILVCFILLGPTSGEGDLFYIFLNKKFSWDEIDITVYAAYGLIVIFIGTTIIMSVFVKWLKIRDDILGTIGCIDRLISSILYGLSNTGVMFYVVAVIDMFSSASTIALRSIASKLVPTEEFAKIFSLFGLCDAVAPLVYKPMYNQVYKNTLDNFPEAFYFLSAFISIFPTIIFAYLIHLERKNPSEIISESTIDITKSKNNILEENCVTKL